MSTETNQIQAIRDAWTCNCAAIAPTMPTCRIEHLSTCNVTIANAEVHRIARMTRDERLAWGVAYHGLGCE